MKYFISSDMKISISNGNNDVLIFPVKEMLTGKKEEEKKEMFFFIEEYLNFKGTKFKNELFKQYQIASDTLDELALTQGLEPLNTSIFYSIMDMIDIEELRFFLKDIIPIPSILGDTFTQDVNLTLNEVQTYTKNQYIDLITLGTILRFVLPVLGKYIYVKSMYVNKDLKELIFLPIFNNYAKLRNMPAFIKLYKFAEKAYEKEATAESDAVRSILSGIPPDETVKWLFACSLFLGLMSISTVNDNDNSNIIKKIFNSILTSRIKKSTDNTKIKDKSKTIGSSSKGQEETQESIRESCRITTKLTPGSIQEINWACQNVDFIIKQLPLEYFTLDKTIAREAYLNMHNLAKQAPFVIPETTFTLLGWIFQSTLLHIDAFEVLQAKELYSAIAVAYSHLYTNGFEDIALMLMSKKPEELDLGYYNNNSTSISKIPEHMKIELDSFYPVKKNKAGNAGVEEVQIAEIAINRLSALMIKEEYLTIARKEHILAVKKTSSSPIVLAGGDIKIRLSELLIFINKRDEKIEL